MPLGSVGSWEDPHLFLGILASTSDPFCLLQDAPRPLHHNLHPDQTLADTEMLQSHNEPMRSAPSFPEQKPEA